MFAYSGHASWSRANNRAVLHTFFGTVQYRKQVIRRAVVLCIVGGIFVIAGSVLTWLAFNDIFGNRVTGPAFLGLAFIFILLAVQRFVKAKKHVSQNSTPDQNLNTPTVGVVLEEGNGEGGSVTVIVDGLQFNTAWRDPDVSDNVPPPSYTEATDTTCTEPPSIVPEVIPEENEPPPTYEEAIESQHSLSDSDIERQPN